MEYGIYQPDKSMCQKITQHQPCGATVLKDMSLTCMTMIDLTTSWFKTIQVPYFDIEDIDMGDTEYIDKLHWFYGKLQRYLVSVFSYNVLATIILKFYV